MYREYRDMPAINRTCMKAAQERAYQKHLEALQKTKSTINTKSPPVPRTVGLNLKKCENEKQRNDEIAKQNKKLQNDLEKIHNRKRSPNKSPQTHFTLRGAYHAEQADQIDRENRRLVNALVNQKPNISRADFYLHKCDHIYQVNKMSIHKKTVPMSVIMRTKLPPMDDVSMPKSTRSRAPRKIPEFESNKEPNTTRDSLFITNKGDSEQLKATMENENQNQIDEKARADEVRDENLSGLLGQKEEEEDCLDDQFNELVVSDSESSNCKDDEKGILDQIADQTADALVDQKNEKKNESDGIFDKIADQATDMLVDQKDDVNNESDGITDQTADALVDQKDKEKNESDGIFDKIADKATDMLVDQKDDANNESDGRLDQVTDQTDDALVDQKDDANNESDGRIDQVTDQTDDIVVDQKDEEKGIFDQIADKATDMLVDQKDDVKNESDGTLDKIVDNNFGALMGKKSDGDEAFNDDED